jgi:hypothetical protein
MKKYVKLVCLIFGLFFVSNSYGQDLITLKNKTVLKVTIVELGTDDVKYKEYNSTNTSILSIKKTEISSIKTVSGKIISMEQASSSSFDSKNAIKLDLFSLVFTKLTIGYERSITPGSSFEIQLGAIGVGKKPTDIIDVSGGFMRIGVKFKTKPDWYLIHGKEGHVLKGAYFRPEITIGSFTETNEVMYSVLTYTPYPWGGGFYSTSVKFQEQKREIPIAGFILNVGKQWTVNDDFCFDFFFGLGVGTGEGTAGNNYAFIGNGLIINAGFKMGVLY